MVGLPGSVAAVVTIDSVAPMLPGGVAAVAPARLLDTRTSGVADTVDGIGEGGGALDAGETVEVPVVDRADVPAVGVAGAVLNVTIVDPSGPGYATVFPCGVAPPNSSNVNWSEGGVVRSSAVTVALSGAGSVCVFVSSAAEVVVDINGWVADPPTAAGVGAGSVGLVVPARLMDSRPGFETFDGAQVGAGRVEAEGTVRVDVAGRAGVPDDVAGVVLSVTTVDASSAGYATAFPCGESQPEASMSNYAAGDTVGSGVFVPVGLDGDVCLYSHAEADIVVDVFAYVGDGRVPDATVSSGAVGLLTPARVLDTREGFGTLDGVNTPGRLSAEGVVRIPLAGRAGVPSGGVTGVAVTVTAVDAVDGGYLTAFDCASRPNASSVNYSAENSIVANSVIVPVSADMEICVFAYTGIDVVVDVSGYLTGTAVPVVGAPPISAEGGESPIIVDVVPAPEPGAEGADIDGDGFVEDVPIDIGYTLPELVLPGGGRWQQRLGADPKPVGEADAVLIAASDADDVGRRVIVEVLDPDEIGRTDFQGVAVAVTPIDGQGPVDVELGLVYREFDTLFGGDWAERLAGHVADGCTWTADAPSPACVVDAEPVSSVNDLVDGVVTIDVTFQDPAPAGFAGAPAALRANPSVRALQASTGTRVAGLLAEVSGSSGSFAASPLAGSGSWSQGGSSGSFNWAYGFDTPSVGRGGPTPGFGVSYSSQMVDGMTSNESSQPGMVGLGWGLSGEASIERSYSSCRSLGGSAQDLCWDGHQVSLNLDGVSSRLVPIDAGFTEWRLERDNGWRVYRRAGAPGSPGVGTVDNNGEYWEIVTLDGTMFRFGFGQQDGEQLQSVWTVPVISANAGDPCRGEPNRICDEAWKWMLDRVVDANGVSQVRSYAPEFNHYGARGRDFSPVRYVRGGVLDTVWWGIGNGQGIDAATHRMQLVTELRCAELANCAEPTSTSRDYPDVPTDMICGASGRCRNNSPSFFTTKRLTQVATAIQVDGSFVAVDRWDLSHAFVGDAQGHLQRLWLRAIKRAGLSGSGAAVDLPAVRFDSYDALLPNRADANPRRGVSAIEMFRVGTIRDELGSEIEVTYGQPDGCSGEPTGGWSTNTQNCYPEWFVPKDFEQLAGFAQFNVHVVTKVRQGTISPTATFANPSDFEGVPLVTSFEYAGGGAYRHAQRRGVPFSQQSWSQWRGYGTVTTRTGAGAAVTTTENTYLRGLDKNRAAGGSEQSVVVSVPAVVAGGAAVQVRDDDWLMGRMLATRSLEPDGRELSASTMLPTTVREVTGVDMGIHSYEGYDKENQLVARMMAPEYDWSRTADSRGGRYAHVTNTASTYEPVHGRMVESYSTGDVLIDAAINNDQCTTTAYAGGLGDIVDRPARVQIFDGPCTGSPLSTVTMTWDGQGRLLTERTAADVLSSVEYGSDPFGRPARVIDPTGAATTVAFASGAGASGAAQAVETTTVTNPLGHSATSTVDARGNTVWSTDPHGHVTTAQFDALGRLTEWVAPSEAGSGQATGRVAYDIDVNNGPTGFAHEPIKVTTSSLVSISGVRVDSVAYIDGLGRAYETQTPAENGGRLVTHSYFDERGHTVRSLAPFPVAGAVGSAPATSGQLASATLETRSTFDALGRSLKSAEVLDGVEQSAVVSAHDGYVTTATATDQATVRSTIDAFGRTVSMIDTGTGLDSKSRFDARGLLVRSGPDASAVRNTYDDAGRLVSVDDPNGGVTSTAYDVAGRTVTTTDAKGNVVELATDELGRPTSRTTNGAVVAEWDYDGAAAGLLDETRSFQPTGTFVQRVLGYDTADRPVGMEYTLPDGTSYRETVEEYSPQGVALASTLGAFDELPAESVATTLTALGAIDTTTVTGAASPLSASSSFDELNRTEQVEVVNGADTVVRSYGFTPRRQLGSLTATLGGVVIQDEQYSYDAVSNITVIDHSVTSTGAVGHRECFDYDTSSRLVDAYTVSVGAACSGAADLGVAPAGAGYQQEFRLGPRGSILGRTDSTTAGVEDRGYAYGNPAAPDALTAFDGVGFAYDPNGARVGTVEIPTNAAYLQPLDASARLVDTRDGGGSPVAAGGDVVIDVAGDLPGGVGVGDVTAVMVNITLVDAPGYGTAVAWPDGGARPSFPVVATEGFAAIAGVATVAVDGGRFRVGIDDTAAHVVVDLVAVYVETGAAVAGGRVLPVDPYRAYDSREDAAGQIQAGLRRQIDVADPLVPADAVGVIATVTATGASEAGFISVLATATDPGGVPLTSTVNFEPGQVRANQVAVFVPIGPDREFTVYAHVDTDVIVDVTGVVTGSGSAVSEQGLFTQLDAPVEVFGSGFDPGDDVEVTVAGVGGVPVDVVAVSLSVSLNAVDAGFVNVYPSDTTYAGVSSLNANAGEHLYGVVTTGVADGSVRVLSAQEAFVSLAVTGYFVNELPDTAGGVTSSGPVVLDYDGDQRLVLTRSADDVDTVFEYWDSNARVAQHFDDGSSVFYLGSVEVTRDGAGVWSTMRRSYAHGGATVASRTHTTTAAPAGAGDEVSVLLGNHQGSVTSTITAGAVSTRYYTPYGERRGPDPADEPTTTGFIGQHEDTNGLTYLNNRHYDPTTGVFVSVDPLVTLTGEPYIYGAANPVTYSDPSGLCAGSEVFDYCITNDGNVLDQGTARLAPATNVNGASPAAVADAIDQLQNGQYDHNHPSVAGDIANGMFNSAINSGAVVANPDGGYMLAACDGEDRCRNYWHSPISELLLGIDSTVLQNMINYQVLTSVSLLAAWPGAAPATQAGVNCRSNSFVAGTLVLMADGRMVPIEEIKIDDEVWALDPETGELAAKPVIDTIIGEGIKKLVSIDYGESQVISTAAHPFWVENRLGWIEATDLRPGDVMLSTQGRSETVEGIERYTEESTVFNLTVADIHTYFVVAGDHPVLVHNCMIGANGTQVTSKTLLTRSKYRIDVENPAPGSRAGQIHLQTPSGQKVLYNFETGQFPGLSNSLNKALAADPKVARAILTGQRYLGNG